MQRLIRRMFSFCMAAAPVVLADSLSYWERQGIVNINFDEPVVTRTVVENQHRENASAADKGHHLFSISGDEAHMPRVLWVDQDCLRIEPAPGTSIKTEFCLKFHNSTRYLSGRGLQQREYRFHAPSTPLVNEELRAYPNGAALVSARHRNTAEARGLDPRSGVTYTFSRVKMDDKGDFFETGETANGVAEQARILHGGSFSALRNLAAHGVKWEDLKQDSPMPGYVVVRPARQLPQGSIWRLTAKAAPGSGLLDSNLGDIHVSRSLNATLTQHARPQEQEPVVNMLELRFNSLVEKEVLRRAFREMRFTLNGVETKLSDDGTTRTAVVNGHEITVRYQGELENQSYSIRPARPEDLDIYWDLEEDEADVTDVRVKYAHPTASPGIKLAIESPVPLEAECTLKPGLQGILGLPLEKDFTTRCSITPMTPALIVPQGLHLPLNGSHKFEVNTVNGSRVQIRIRRWEADAAPAALQHINRHLEQQERRGGLGALLYRRAVMQARIKAGQATEDELPALPEGYERVREVYHNRVFLQPAGGQVVARQDIPLPRGGNKLLRSDLMVLNLDTLCGGQLQPGMYLVEMDFYPSAAVEKSARELGINPAELVQRQDKLICVSDLAAFGLQGSDARGIVVLNHSDGAVVENATATLVGEENITPMAPAKQGIIPLNDSEGSSVIIRCGKDFALFHVEPHRFWYTEEDTEVQEAAELRAMMWTDRELYRPGDKVHVRGFLRAVDGQNRITHSVHRELQLHFDAPDGSRLFSRVFDVDEYGAFSQELTMPEGEDDVCGRYTITIGTTRPRTLARLHPRCEVFRRDSFRVETEVKTEKVAPGEVVFHVQAKDYNGMPMNKGRVELWVDSGLALEGSHEETHGTHKNYTLATTLPLAEDGTAEFRKAFTGAAKEDFSVVCRGSVVNEREEHIRFSDVSNHAPAELKPRLLGMERLQLRCSDCGEAMHYGLSVRVTLLGSRVRSQKLPNGFTITGKQEEKIWSQWVNVPADSVEGVELPLAEEIRKCGKEYDDYFTVVVEGRDYRNHLFAYRFTHHASSLGKGERELSVSSGEKPSSMVVESLVDGEMLLVVRSGSSCRAMKMAVQRGRAEFLAPLLEHETGQVDLYAALIQANPETGMLEHSCQHHLKWTLPALQNELKLDLELPGTVRPGTQQTLAGRVTQPGGNPSQSVVTLYAVDAGMLSLSGYEAPDVVNSLSRWRSTWLRLWGEMAPLEAARHWQFSPLPGVWQGEALMPDGSWKHQPWWMRDYHGLNTIAAPMAMKATAAQGTLTGRNEAQQVNRAKALATADSATEGATQPAAPRMRTNFEPLALWRSALKTDAEGRFSTTCTMPDTLTTYRVIAVAADKGGSRFGTSEGEICVNQPVMLTVGAPLFMSVGDKLQLPVTITNNTAAEGTWQVQMEGSADSRQVTLAAGGSTTLFFEVSPQQPGTHTSRWVAGGTTGQDAVESSFEVRHPAPLLKEAHHLVLETGKGELLPKKLLAQELAGAPGCELELLVSANPLLHLQGGVDFLLEQSELPFLECRASALLPWLLYDRLAPLCPQMAQTPADKVQRTIARSVENLLKYQNEDGGLPFWQSRGASSPWVSAHVAMVLRLAEERGHAVPQRKWYNLLRYLEKTDFQKAHPLTRYEVARALQNRDAQRDALQAALAATDGCWLCSGSVRSDLEFLEYLRTNNDGRHEAFLRWMRTRAADYRHHSSWRSAWSLYALLTYVGNSPGAQVEALLKLSHGVAVLSRDVYRVKNPDMNFSYTALRGSVYAVLRAKAQPQQTDYPGVTEKGLQMTRVYEKQGEDGIWREAVDFAVGDVVRVSLTCAKASEQDLHHLVLEDYLPAGMEAVNPNVPSQAAGLEPLSWSDYFDHREYLADRVRGFCTRWPGRDVVNMRYYARVKRAGSATAPPAQAQLFYEPQTYGLSPSMRVETKEK